MFSVKEEMTRGRRGTEEKREGETAQERRDVKRRKRRISGRAVLRQYISGVRNPVHKH
jgi:hypothetical protein